MSAYKIARARQILADFRAAQLAHDEALEAYSYALSARSGIPCPDADADLTAAENRLDSFRLPVLERAADIARAS